jgi:regulatory protein
MSKIVALKLADRKNKVTVLFEDSSSFAISKETVTDAGLHVGLDLLPDQIEELKQRDQHYACLNAALRYLTCRPRSKTEVENKLRQRGFSRNVVNGVIQVLKGKNLIDDASFARLWTENRQAFKPRSKRLIRQELRQRGIEAQLSDEATSDLDDEDSAYRAALKKSRTLASLDHNEFRQRLARHLQLKGFSFGVIETVVERLWQELRAGEKTSG